MPRNWLRSALRAGARRRREPVRVELAVAGFAHPLRVYTRNPSTALDRRAVGRPARLGRRAADRRHRAGAAHPAAGAVKLAPSAAAGDDVRRRARRRSRQDRLAGAGRRHGGEGGLAEGLRDRRGRGARVLVRARSSRAPRPKRASVATPPPPTATPWDSPSAPTATAKTSLTSVRKSVAMPPSMSTPTAMPRSARCTGTPAYSPAHWSEGNRLAVLSDTGDLALGRARWRREGTLARTGDATGDRADFQP